MDMSRGDRLYIRISGDSKRKIKEVSIQLGISQSDLIRQAINKRLHEAKASI
jgi:predicted DNA-binding protein